MTDQLYEIQTEPHIGHLYSLVTADIFARWQRILEPHRPVHFLTGTDEHGLKIQKAAKERGVSPQVLCDTLTARFKVRLSFILVVRDT